MGKEQWSSTEVAVKLLGRQQVPGRYAATRIQRLAAATRKLSSPFIALGVAGARVTMAAQENRIFNSVYLMSLLN